MKKVILWLFVLIVLSGCAGSGGGAPSGPVSFTLGYFPSFYGKDEPLDVYFLQLDQYGRVLNSDELAYPTVDQREFYEVTLQLKPMVQYITVYLSAKGTSVAFAEATILLNRGQKEYFVNYWIDVDHYSRTKIPQVLASKWLTIPIEQGESFFIPLDFDELPYYIFEFTSTGSHAMDLEISVDQGSVIHQVWRGDNLFLRNDITSNQQYMSTVSTGVEGKAYVTIRPSNVQLKTSGSMTVSHSQTTKIDDLSHLIAGDTPDVVFGVARKPSRLYQIDPLNRQIHSCVDLPWESSVAAVVVDGSLYTLINSNGWYGQNYGHKVGIWDITANSATEIVVETTKSQAREIIVAPSLRQIFVLAFDYFYNSDDSELVVYDMDTHDLLYRQFLSGKAMALDEISATLYVSGPQALDSYSVASSGLVHEQKSTQYYFQAKNLLLSPNRTSLILSSGGNAVREFSVTDFGKALGNWYFDTSNSLDYVAYNHDASRIYSINRDWFMILDANDYSKSSRIHFKHGISSMWFHRHFTSNSDGSVLVIYNATTSEIHYYTDKSLVPFSLPSSLVIKP